MCVCVFLISNKITDTMEPCNIELVTCWTGVVYTYLTQSYKNNINIHPTTHLTREYDDGVTSYQVYQTPDRPGLCQLVRRIGWLIGVLRHVNTK